MDVSWRAEEGPYPGLQQEKEHVHHALPAQEEERARLQRLREEAEQRVQTPPVEPHPAREEAWSEEGDPVRRPRPVPQDEEREEVRQGASDAEGEAPRQEGAQLESSGEARQQASQIRGLHEPILLRHRRRDKSRTQIPHEIQTDFANLT